MERFLYALIASAVIFAVPAFSADPNLPGAPVKDELLIGCEHDYPPYCIVRENGEADGFSVELIKAAAAAAGRKATFKTGYWDDLKKDLAEGRLHALPLVARTEEREKIYDFTFPYITMHGAIVVREDNTDIRSPADLKGKEVLVLKGDSSEEYMQQSGLGAKIVPRSTFSEAMRELSDGKCDALVIQRLLSLELMKDNGIQNLRIAVRLPDFVQHFCFAVREGEKETLSLLNEGLSIAMADGSFRHLQSKWFTPLEAMELRKSRIVVGGDNDYPPYEYIDENGQPAGFNVDLTRAIARQIGISVDIELGPWNKIRDDLNNGSIDLLQGMFYSQERDNTFRFSPPHTIVNYVIARRNGPGELNCIADLKGKTILVQSGDIMHDMAVKNGLGKEIIPMDSQEDALRLLSEGKGDCALVAKIPALYFIEKNGWDKLRVSDLPLLSPEYCYAALRGRESVLDSFIPALAALKRTGEYRQIQTKWFSPYDIHTDFGTVIKYIASVAIPLLLLLVVSVAGSRSLKRLVAQRTKELVDERNALRISEEENRFLLNNTSDFIARFDRNGVMMFCTEASLRFHGYKPEELINTSGFDRIHPEDRERVQKNLRRLVEDGVEERTEYRLKRKDGEYMWVEASGRLVFSAAGEPEVVVVQRDITERKQYEERLRQSEKMEAIGHLAGGIAHDFNNQLTGILGYAEALSKRLDDKSLREYAENIMRAARRSADLTRDLLAFSRKGKFQATPVDVHKLIEETVSLLRHSISRNVEIDRIFKATSATVNGDPSLLQNAFLNLAINARDAMPEGGRLTFATEIVGVDEGSRQSLRSKLSYGKYVKISVADTGHGMSKEVMERAFEPFFTTKEAGRGTGMGLASVFGTMQSHHGAIDVESAPGKGSTFTIYLPSQDDPSSPVKAAPQLPSGGRKIRILAVDDEEMIRDMLSMFLSSNGYGSLLFEDGPTALEFYRKSWREIDLVILDMEMPKMHGREVFAGIRRINPSAAVLVVSGYSVDGEAQKLLDAGARGFLHKPFDMEELYACIAKALSG